MLNYLWLGHDLVCHTIPQDVKAAPGRSQRRGCNLVSSLVSSFIHKMNTAEFKSATFPNAGPRHLLDDSVMEPHVPSRGQAESSTLSSGISIGTSCKHTLLIKALAQQLGIEHCCSKSLLLFLSKSEKRRARRVTSFAHHELRNYEK